MSMAIYGGDLPELADSGYSLRDKPKSALRGGLNGWAQHFNLYEVME